MVNMNELNWAIDELERDESSFKNYATLADLYTVRDHNTPKEQAGDSYEMSQFNSCRSREEPDVVGDYGDSDFLQTARGLDAASAWRVIDELMDTLKVVNRKVYNSVIQKLESA